MRLNLNETIKVKLTDLGKDIYYHKYDRINAFFGIELCKPSYPKVDDDGYTEFQLWCFIELYGEHIGMASPNVIEPLDIVFDEPTIDPVRKGKWIKGTGENGVSTSLFCSECNYENRHWYEWNYCPNCGVKMGEGEQE